jgi:uncharacterized membrane protein
MKLLSDVGLVEFGSVDLDTVLVSVQERCMVCTKRTKGMEIVLNAPNGTPR